MTTHKLRPERGASRRGVRTITRKMLVATSLTAVALAGASVTASAATTQKGGVRSGQHPVIVHVLPGTFHQTYLANLQKMGQRANPPVKFSFARGASPLSRAKHVGRSCTESNCPLPYNGGPVQHSPHVYVLYWGPNWQTDPTQDTALNYTSNFFAGLGNTQEDVWSPIMSQYNDGSGNITFGSSVIVGSYQDSSSPPYGTTQSQFAAEANTVASSLSIADTANAQIIIVTQPGTCPNGFAPSGCPGNHAYCAYHSYANVPYTNLPYQTDAGSSCGENSVSGLNDGFSIVGGHEFAETATDPHLNAWVDSSDPGGGENGDKCAWTNLGFANLSTGSYPVQPTWSNSEYYRSGNGCPLTEFDISLDSSGNSLNVGQSVTLTATTNISVTPTPWYIAIWDLTTGTLKASCGTGTSCSATVTGDTARSDDYVGFISKQYGSDVKLQSFGQYVTWYPGSTTTTVSIPSPPAAGGTATVNVSVSTTYAGSGVAAPAGSVHVSDGAHSCLATLSGGNGAATGSCSLAEPHAGGFTVSGAFAGDSNFTGSNGSAPLTVRKATSTTTFKMSKASIPYGSQQKETFTITVVSAGSATGTVKILAGTTTVCKTTLSAGKGKCSLKSKQLKKATYKLHAAYGGDSNRLASASPTAKLKVT